MSPCHRAALRRRCARAETDLPLGVPETCRRLEKDGFRALVSVAAGRVVLRSRRGTEMGPAFPEIVAGAEQLPDTTALDGELVVWDAAGRLAFERLQDRPARCGAGQGTELHRTLLQRPRPRRQHHHPGRLPHTRHQARPEERRPARTGSPTTTMKGCRSIRPANSSTGRSRPKNHWASCSLNDRNPAYGAGLPDPSWGSGAAWPSLSSFAASRQCLCRSRTSPPQARTYASVTARVGSRRPDAAGDKVEIE
ncbi:hypothetical protein QC029_16775 [Streptomyces sp. DH37]|nr:hypothetical protein [Streptomyces sp. DH37]MDG9703860.1 hypothetical protein [Streptomyces sp. DH37]